MCHLLLSVGTLYIISHAWCSDKITIIVYQFSSQICLNWISVKFLSFPDGMIVVGMHIVDTDREIFVLVINDDICIFSYCNGAFVVLLKEPSMFWEWAILLAVQATLLCTAAKLVVPERLLAQAAGLLDMIRIVALIVVFSVTTTGNITICLMNFGTPGFVYGVALCSLAAIIAIIVLLKRRRYSTCSMPM